MEYDSTYSIAQRINTVIGNSPLPFDSVYSICESIYTKLATIPAESDIFVVDNTNGAAVTGYRNYIPVFWNKYTSEAIREKGVDYMFLIWRFSGTGSGANQRFATQLFYQFDREVPLDYYFKYYNTYAFPEQDCDLKIRDVIKFVGDDFNYYDRLYTTLNRSHGAEGADTTLIEEAYQAYPNAVRVLQNGHYYSTKVYTNSRTVDSINWYYNPYGYIDSEGVYTITSETTTSEYDNFYNVDLTESVILYFDEGTSYDEYIRKTYYNFDSVYSILLAILDLVEGGGSGTIEYLKEIYEQLTGEQPTTEDATALTQEIINLIIVLQTPATNAEIDLLFTNNIQ